MSLCCLTLIFQSAVEEEITDFMLAHEAASRGFHTSIIEGHGHDARLATLKEKVRGRARKTRMDLVLQQEEAEGLLADIRAAFPNLHLTYWTSQISTFGRLP